MKIRKLGTSEVDLFNKDSLPKSLDVQAMQGLLPKIDVSALFSNVSANRESCNPKPFPCDHTTPYRTFSGWCNNLRFPHYGNTFNPFRRLLDPAYNDGFDEPRKLGSDGRPLPSPRLIANSVHSNVEFEPHVKYTHMLMQFAQILDHDFTHSPVHSGMIERWF